MPTKPKTVSEYIQQAPPESKKALKEMRKILKQTAPKASESLKWGIPAFSYNRILFTYAGFKKHIGFYPTPSALTHFEKELASYKVGKGSIQFPLDTPLPTNLIKKIAQFRVKELQTKDAKWM